MRYINSRFTYLLTFYKMSDSGVEKLLETVSEKKDLMYITPDHVNPSINCA